MKSRWAAAGLGLLLVLATDALSQKQVARLEHEASLDLPHSASSVHSSPESRRSHHSSELQESPLSRMAAKALFVDSDLPRANMLTAQALRQNHRDGEALFVRMEVAAMQANTREMLDAATRLCEVAGPSQDPRAVLAVTRLQQAAANTIEFREVAPRLQALASSSPEWPQLNLVLLSAAMDGLPGLDPRSTARAAGILTDWRMVGPVAHQSMLDLTDAAKSTTDDLSRSSFGNRYVENFQFADGQIGLPAYLPARGVYYASSEIAVLHAGAWSVALESHGPVEVFVDGELALRRSDAANSGVPRLSKNLDLAPGPHKILLKFAAASAPLRLSATPAVSEPAPAVPARVSGQELVYWNAAQAYAAGDFAGAIAQIHAIRSLPKSAPLQFLMAQSWQSFSPAAWEYTKLLAPSALAADEALAQQALADARFADAAELARAVLLKRPNRAESLQILAAAMAADNADASSTATASRKDYWLRDESLVWQKLLAEHPSCATWKDAIARDRERKDGAEAAEAEKNLDGCAPESLDYAQALSARGEHETAAQNLRQLLAAAPLNRGALQMLVQELQLAGDDSGAQRAAADWLRIAANANDYRRLAALEVEPPASLPMPDPSGSSQPFYAQYRRDALTSHRNAGDVTHPEILLEDHVVIVRPDGSVSLYVHNATRLGTEDLRYFAQNNIPAEAQVLRARAFSADGQEREARVENGRFLAWASQPLAGDILDREYVVNYLGDGGISQHPEAFQFVFGSFYAPVEQSRFVVLTPATSAGSTVVIATGDAPSMSSGVAGATLVRMWESGATSAAVPVLSSALSFPIVRVVDQENGWTVPRNAERQRRIETIHPGPRLEESSLRQFGRTISSLFF